MSEIIKVGLDLAKRVLQVHGADASGRVVLRKKLQRDQVLAFFSGLGRGLGDAADAARETAAGAQ